MSAYEARGFEIRTHVARCWEEGVGGLWSVRRVSLDSGTCAVQCRELETKGAGIAGNSQADRYDLE